MKRCGTCGRHLEKHPRVGANEKTGKGGFAYCELVFSKEIKADDGTPYRIEAKPEAPRTKENQYAWVHPSRIVVES